MKTDGVPSIPQKTPSLDMDQSIVYAHGLEPRCFGDLFTSSVSDQSSVGNPTGSQSGFYPDCPQDIAWSVA